ncbi:MAG: hypothetical protein ACRET2_12885, partial [Steroidobacteraceae bacterium]
MTTNANEFDVAKAVADQLQGLQKEQQQKILRWVMEHLGLELRVASSADQRMGETSTAAGDAAISQGAASQRTMDIKTFVDSRSPKNDVQLATVIAYYHRFEASKQDRKEYIDANLLRESMRHIGQQRTSAWAPQTLNNAKTLGYLDSPERGQFRINSVGENLVVMTLPGTGTQ